MVLNATRLRRNPKESYSYILYSIFGVENAEAKKTSMRPVPLR